MAVISPDAERALGSDFLARLRTADLYLPLRTIVDEGWVMEDGANLLAALRDAYFGDRKRSATVGHYESAVNGRGIPDDDINASGPDRVCQLMRRGVAFAWAALYAAKSSERKPLLMSRISMEPTLFDSNVVTGYVTIFSSDFADALGVGPLHEKRGVQILLESSDCPHPLPG
ncbi:hypothetical protein GCM10022254_40810 [Actinomadura meridiana]|uniref:Uncharacterized protein n=2 Tax=Actinomadura meridiana TaxID=559626 RepID=A0ABP8C727_9ACTN